MNDLKHVSRERLKQIEEDARKGSVRLPTPISFREGRIAEDAERELRRRGKEL